MNTRLAQLAVVVGLASVTGFAQATTVALVHGRNKNKPTSAEVCDYWGGCSCNNSTNGLGWAANDVSGWCSYAGGNNTSRARATIVYDSSLAWYADWSTSEPICDVAAQINAINDSTVHTLAHSAGGLVVQALLTDSVNGWGSACGTNVVTGAANKITLTGSVSSPYSGTKIADAVYGHLNASSGNVIADFFHNACGNVVGFGANLLFDEANDMTYALQTGEAMSTRNYLDQTAGKTLETSWGTTRDGDRSLEKTGLKAAETCAGLEEPNDGFVPKYSAKGCANAGSGSTCSGRPANWMDGEYAAINHDANRRNGYTTSTNSVGHAHGMGDLVWGHTGI